MPHTSQPPLWMKEPSVRTIPREKLDFLQKLVFESSSLSRKELLPFLMSLAQKSKEDSLLRDTIAEAYKDQSGKDAIISATHGGLECGMFIEKIPGLHCVSIGPDLREVHSTRERLSISSTARLWDLVCDVLKRLK